MYWPLVGMQCRFKKTNTDLWMSGRVEAEGWPCFGVRFAGTMLFFSSSASRTRLLWAPGSAAAPFMALHHPAREQPTTRHTPPCTRKVVHTQWLRYTTIQLSVGPVQHQQLLILTHWAFYICSTHSVHVINSDMQWSEIFTRESFPSYLDTVTEEIAWRVSRTK